MSFYKDKKFIFLAVILFICAGAGYYIWYDLKSAEVEPPINLETKFPSGDGEISSPDLNRPINISVNLLEETKSLATQKIGEITGELKKNEDLTSHWLDLASYYKLIGDYEGAREIWEYLIFKNPSNFVPYYNLANLYGYYLKNNTKAEEYFNKAIEKNPHYIATYAAFYEFYVDVHGEEGYGRAEDVLIRGLEANPGDSSLTALLELHNQNLKAGL